MGVTPSLFTSFHFKGTLSVNLILIVVIGVKLLPSLLTICIFDLPGPLPHGLLLFSRKPLFVKCCTAISEGLCAGNIRPGWRMLSPDGEEWPPSQSSQLPFAFATELRYCTPQERFWALISQVFTGEVLVPPGFSFPRWLYIV